MKKEILFISVLFFSFAAFSQTDDKKANRYYTSGCEKIFRNDYKGAIVEFSWAIMRDSDFLQAYENRGVAKYYLKDYSGAIADFNRALELNPLDYNTLGRRGWARFRIKDFGGAIADFSRALQGDKENIKYYNIRGEAKYCLNDFPGAIRDFTRAINLWSAEKTERSKAYYWRGLIRIDTGDKKNGCLDLEKSGKLGYEMAFELMEVYCR